MLNKSLIQQEYDYLKDNIFLNVSSVVMPANRVRAAYRNFMDEYVANFGADVVPRAWQIVSDAREKVANLIHAANPHEIAFVKNTCEGVSILADGYPLGSGDNIVIADQEHQSILFPWINARGRRGISMKIVKSVDRQVRTQDMIAAIDANTKILAVSAAQFSTGYLSDLQALGDECSRRGVIFMVDAIQALGRIDIDVQKMHIDYLVAGGNKGLLATLGAGFVYCSDRIVQKIIPPYAGYQSVVSHLSPPSITTNFDTIEWHPHARRFEGGNLNYNGILAISKGVELLLELGISNIQSHIQELEHSLREQLRDLPLTVVQPDNSKYWSGIICVYYPPEKESEVVRILEDNHIYGTMRGGYIRFGINFYNTMEQMKIAASALYEIAAS